MTTRALMIQGTGSAIVSCRRRTGPDLLDAETVLSGDKVLVEVTGKTA